MSLSGTALSIGVCIEWLLLSHCVLSTACQCPGSVRAPWL